MYSIIFTALGQLPKPDGLYHCWSGNVISVAEALDKM